MTLKEFFTLSTWWGKIFGAIFGFLTGGSLGALFGLLVGNFFDRGLASYYTNPHLLYYSEKRKAVQKIFFETTFLVMGHIAKADGRVSEQEIRMAKQLMKEMRLSNQEKTEAKRLFNAGKESSFKLEATLFELAKTCRDDRGLLKLFVDIQYRAAQADGLSTNKIKALDAVFSFLGFAPLHKQNRFYSDFGDYSSTQEQQQHQSHNQRYHQSRRQSPPRDNLAQAYALLEVDAHASKHDVKRAYRRLLSQNHPDKLIAKGLPEAMIKLANEKTQKIVKAYQLICESKGW